MSVPKDLRELDRILTNAAVADVKAVLDRYPALPKPTRAPKAPKRIRTRRTLAAVRAQRKAAGVIDPDSWQAVVEFYGGRCAYCERLTWAHRDHVQALSRGGDHVIANLVPACAGCNMDKGSSRDWQPKRRHPFMVPA